MLNGTEYRTTEHLEKAVSEGLLYLTRFLHEVDGVEITERAKEIAKNKGYTELYNYLTGDFKDFELPDGLSKDETVKFCMKYYNELKEKEKEKE